MEKEYTLKFTFKEMEMLSDMVGYGCEKMEKMAEYENDLDFLYDVDNKFLKYLNEMYEDYFKKGIDK